MPDDQAGRDTPGERPRPATAALDATVRRALDDLDTLITTLSARSDKGLSAIIDAAARPGDTLLASPAVFTARCAELLTTPVKTIVHKNDLLADLLRACDVLNSASYPASAATFRMTAFYTGNRRIETENGNADIFAADANAMWWTRWAMRALAGLSIAVLVFTILLSTAALNGRMISGDNAAIRAEFEAAMAAVAALEAPRLAAARPDLHRPEMGDVRIRPCDAIGSVATGEGTFRIQTFPDPAVVAACDRYDDRLRRWQVNEAQIRDWNRWVDGLFFGIGRRVPPQGAVVGPADPAEALATSERVLAARIEALAALLLPLYGFIGSAAFVFRRLMQKVQAAELDATELRQGVIRLALGTILGGVIGLFFGPEGIAMTDDALPVKAFGLSALALLAGYSVGLVFTFFDFFIHALFQPLRTATQEGGAPKPDRRPGG